MCNKIRKIFLMSHSYVANTYENDIALVKLQKLPFTEKCLVDNPAISAVCVPWSTHLFQPNHTCSISGWGRTAGMDKKSYFPVARRTVMLFNPG